MTRALSTRRVFLVGFMGAGKSSVGRALASRLGWRFCDLDQVIEKRESKTVAEIFAEREEAGFRVAETKALEELLQDPSWKTDLVVALGGGTFVQPQNRRILEEAQAITVLLEAPVDELRRRCTAGGSVRPLAGDLKRFEWLYEERLAAYKMARHKVNTMGKTVEEVTAEIASILTSITPGSQP
ncbi:MAG TPA: shikimate kinase [Candidatus Angelobacter sp.]|nr:shikimate kinase [Candidatus Angelobacter sp.]